MEKLHGVLVTTLLEMLQFLVLIIALVLREGPTQGINDR